MNDESWGYGTLSHEYGENSDSISTVQDTQNIELIPCYVEGGCFVEATDQSSSNCSSSSEWKCASGKKYYGRGPLQIAWNENYGPMGVALGFDGINYPELVATNPVLSFRGSLWFWMTPQPPAMYSCHQAILSQSQGFKEVNIILNEFASNVTTATPAPVSINSTRGSVGTPVFSKQKIFGFSDAIAGAPVSFSYSTLASATKNFTAILGQGGFGIVYKGELSTGEVIAVKVLKESSHSDWQFLREIETLGRLHHINLVRLVGFCMEKTKKILVYEFISNSSLEKHLFDRPGKTLGVDSVLNWKESPKISDFGLAKIIKREESKVVSNLKGTPGYVAPEFWENRQGGLSTKFDVYSFGMVALELVAGRPNFKEELPSEQAYFPFWAFINVASPAQILDHRIAHQSNLQQVQFLLLVAMWCIQEEPSLRPSMGRVVQYLEGSIEVPPNPPKPFQDVSKYISINSSCSSSLPCCEILSEAR
ncbi:hypothetical protein GOP47_0010393 [Adiantum capillus-veneris]|uniref:non-specific serine/threonine protein kinase n=1 Tax=Adiantum capillus-veneris TaxID=13818 RepID=A0A9D4UV73_ADICA|nr:hypothetical protein GOP47_0010393 [Adiantum capillus-veneris]